MPKVLTKKGFIEFKYYLLQIYSFIKNSKRVKFRKLNHWGKINFNRVALINLIASKSSYNLKYLEIGCDTNLVFDSLPIKEKIGVDPNRGGNIRLSSDDFFSTNKDFFDLIFIDGLHEYEQCQKDLINSLKYLANDGVILIHDLIPVDWKTEHVPRLFEQWNGDIWKVIFEIIESKNLELHIVDCDNGVGILRKKDGYSYKKMNEFLNFKNFDYFVNNFNRLPIISFEESINMINKRL